MIGPPRPILRRAGGAWVPIGPSNVLPPIIPGTSWATSVAFFGNLRNNFTGYVGGLVSCPSAFTITALGRWIVAGNSQPHTLAIYNQSYALLASATLNTAGQTAGQFAYVELMPHFVATGGSVTTMFFQSLEQNGGDFWYDVSPPPGTQVNHTGDFAYVGPSVGGSNSIAATIYVPPTFLYSIP